MFKAFFISLTACLISSMSLADCDFKSGKFIEELSDPSYIQLFEIEVPKSSKYAKNFLKIAASNTLNISPKFKKNFNAKVTVHYPFGLCKYNSRIRQSGDWKDHISMTAGGKLIRSLDIKLKSGNILGSVKFKLLIPETRQGINEILATLILKQSGFLSPETFEIQTIVNGSKATMLFQENAHKELLEKNFRPESAIFEGDEDLLWSFQDFDNLALESLALSRLVNDNWFLKGSSSQKISLKAYAKLQSSYLDYSIDERLGQIIDPNNGKTDTFSNYFFTLLAMNGAHALKLHNRKYYYNAITSTFEPIYYDGMVTFDDVKTYQLDHKLNDVVSRAFKHSIEKQFLNKLTRIAKSQELKTEFFKRVNFLKGKDQKFRFVVVNAEKFFDNAIFSFLKNIEKLDEKINTSEKVWLISRPISSKIETYENLQNLNGVSQKIISRVKLDGGNYLVTFRSGDVATYSFADMAEIVSNNTFKKERVLVLDIQDFDVNSDNLARRVPNFPGKITTSPGIKIDIFKREKLIIFTQSKYDDWALINSANLNKWKIKFNGIPGTTSHEPAADQRFNKYGLTGCLSFYQSYFSETIIEVDNGMCEDSLNIIASEGQLKSISINNAFADAVDIDFSTISILESQVYNAGNDCLDVSRGTYVVKTINLRGCGDKGISVGEQSTLNANLMNLDFATIGISSKDFSKVEIEKANIKNVKFCAEVIQKKQEFGGAYLKVEDLDCNENNNIDENSVFIRGGS